MQEYLACIEDICEQLINVDKVISNLELVNLTLKSLNHLSFYYSLMLTMRGNVNPLAFMELQGLLL